MLFKCSFCFKTFTKKSSIKVHVKSCRKRTESTVKDSTSKKRRGRPKTFTKIVAFKTVGEKKSISDNSISMSTAGGEVSSEHSEHTPLATSSAGDQSTSMSTAVNTPRLASGSFNTSNKDGNSDQNYSFTTNMIQPVKLETFWVSKAPGKPSECIKSTVTNLEKLRTTPSKMFKSSELAKIGNFQCYSCNRYYSFRQHFERHVQLCNHNRKIEEISDFQTLRCLECNQSFSYLQHLKRHAAKHLGLDRFKCKLCNYSSYYWSDTKYHLTSHKGVNLKHPEYYILNVSSDCVALKSDNTNEWERSPAKTWDTPRTVLKRVAESPSLVSTGSSSSGSGVVKTLVLTEQDGMLKVVSDPNQIAKMVNQQGSPPLKRLRISADASQAPAIIKALPDIQKAVLSPGLKIEKRESTLMTKNLPSPTLSDPTPTSEVFEPAVDPDKQHISWVRKPLKDPDALPFKWDDDDEADGEAIENNSSISVSIASTPTSTTSTTTSSTPTSTAATNITVQSSSVENEKLRENSLASGVSSKTTSISETESKSTSLADKPVPENFSEPPILTKEVSIVKSSLGKEKDDLQMPRISASDVTVPDTSTSQESVVTFMLNENNELLLISPEGSGGSSSSSGGGGGSAHSSSQHVVVSNKDFFSVSHPSSSSPSSTSTSTTMSPFGSSVSSAKVMNKPKTYWDLQHKNTLRRLPNRGLVSTSNLSFPSASRRVTKSPNAPPIMPTVTSSTSTSLQTSTVASSSSSSSTGTSEK
ncbi:unnamed protein product [Acanthosepion pharaonis]|nr:unnamed protein product [Sepia pharaonis]